MKRIKQTYIAKQAGLSPAFINLLVNTKKRPSWKRAKQLAEITNTNPILWLEGSADQIKSALKNNNRASALKLRG